MDDLLVHLRRLGLTPIVQEYSGNGPQEHPIVIHLSNLDLARLLDYLDTAQAREMENPSDRPWGLDGPRYRTRADAEREQTARRLRAFSDY